MLSDYHFIYIHGAYGGPTENWIPWLSEQLKKDGAKVSIPTFPTPEGQDLRKWLEIFDKEHPKLTNKTVMIGHSLGVPFILRVLERSSSPIKACFLVSAFVHLLSLDEFDKINRSFVQDPVDWKKVRANCEKFFVYNSDNDPYVPLRLGQEIADNLNTKLNVVHNGGHINASAGFTKFEPVLTDIKSSLAD